MAWRLAHHPLWIEPPLPSVGTTVVMSAATSAPSDGSMVNPSQLPSAAVRVARQLGPDIGEVLAAESDIGMSKLRL